MSNAALQSAIDEAWEARDSVSSETQGEVRDAVEQALAGLDAGDFRVAEKIASTCAMVRPSIGLSLWT